MAGGPNGPRGWKLDVIPGPALADLGYHGGFPFLPTTGADGSGVPREDLRQMHVVQRLARRAWLGLACSIALTVIPACGSQEPDAPVIPPSGAVSTATPEATAVGIRILALGGNAVDAAVAISLALGVTEPSESGLGGTAVMLIAPPGGNPVVIHSAPEIVGSYLRPSTVSVLAAAWKKYGSGKLTWEQLVQPAQRIAERGYSLGRFRHLMIVKEYRRLETDSVATRLLLNADHSIPGEGTTVAFPTLASTLAQLADAGSDDPAGELASLISDDLAGLIDAGTARALGSVAQVKEESPMSGTYRGWTVLVPGNPYGGSVLLRALDMLQAAPLAVLKQDGESRTAWLAESLSYAITPSSGTVGSYMATIPALPVAVMDSALRRIATPVRRPPPSPGASPAPAAGPAATPPTAAPSPVPAPAATDPLGDGTGTETSHFSVVDASGMAVSVTQSLGGPFGAGASRLGFFMGRAPEATPAATEGSSASRGLSTGADPWGEPTSWAMPTVLMRGDTVGLVLGSAGGPRALSAVLQTITAWVDGERPIDRAISTPRLHMEADTAIRPRLVLEGVVSLDPGGATAVSLAPWGEAVRQLAAMRGFAIGEWDTGLQYLGISPFFGGVNAVARQEEGWAAAADPRRDGEGRVLGEEDVLKAERDPEGEGDLLDSGASPPTDARAPSVQ